MRNLVLLDQVPQSNGAEITIYCKKRYKGLVQEIANVATFQKLEQVFPDARTFRTIINGTMVCPSWGVSHETTGVH